jgi:glutamate carboxypeptidase
MAAFAACGAPGMPLRMVTTSDEEIASRLAREVIRMRRARPAPCSTPSPAGRAPPRPAQPAHAGDHARPQGRRLPARRDDRQGRPFRRPLRSRALGHSRSRPEDRAAACADRSERGVTVNVGLIGGGQTVNTIAPSAWAEIDLRYVEPEQRDAMVSAIRADCRNARSGWRDQQTDDFGRVPAAGADRAGAAPAGALYPRRRLISASR